MKGWRRRLHGRPGWWQSMLSPIVAMAYLQTLVQDLPQSTAVARLGALVVSSALLAGYGLVVNDWSDIEVDRRAGKPNIVASLAEPVRIGLATGLALAGAVPWLVVRLNRAGIIALAVIYLLPLLYSARPVRLKERAALGLVADAANALIAPAVFVIALFGRSGSASPALGAITGSAMVAWSVGYGTRGIILHQLDDELSDRRSAVRTFVTERGADGAQRLARTLFPLEVAGLTVMLGVVMLRAPVAGTAFVAYAALFQAARRVGAVTSPFTAGRAANGYVMLAEFYDVWPSTILVAGLVTVRPSYWWVAAAHLLLFGAGIRKQGRDVMFMVVKLGAWAIRRSDGAERPWLARNPLIAAIIRLHRRRASAVVLPGQVKSLEEQVHHLGSQLDSARRLVLDLLPEVIHPSARTRSTLEAPWVTAAVPPDVRCEIAKEDPLFRYLLEADVSDPHAAYLSSGLLHVATFDALVRARFGSWDPVQSWLDVNSGYGRDTRFLAHLLAPEHVWVCDPDSGAVTFQRRHFAVNGCVSGRGPEALVFDRSFTCITAMSLFTHLPHEGFASWLSRLWALAEEGGLLVFTVHDVTLAGEAQPAHDDPSRDQPVASFVSEAFVRSLLKDMGVSGGRRFARAIDDRLDLWVVPKGSPDLPSDFELPTGVTDLTTAVAWRT